MKTNNLRQLPPSSYSNNQELTAVARAQLRQKQEAERVLNNLATLYPQINGVRRVPKIA